MVKEHDLISVIGNLVLSKATLEEFFNGCTYFDLIETLFHVIAI